MTRLKRIILMTVLYAALFAASFFLVTYFNGYHFMKAAVFQLALGILALIIAVFAIFLLFRRSGYRIMDMITVEEADEEKEEDLSLEESSGIAEASGKPLSDGNSLTDEQTMIATKAVREFSEDTEAEVNSATEEEKRDAEPAADHERADSTLRDNVITMKVPEDNDPLTKTQINYINLSANSYINESGMPQLVMTNDLSKEDIERRKRQYERPEEMFNQEGERISHDEQVDDDFYIQDERQDRIAGVLGRIILIQVIILILISGYYVYSRFLG